MSDIIVLGINKTLENLNVVGANVYILTPTNLDEVLNKLSEIIEGVKVVMIEEGVPEKVMKKLTALMSEVKRPPLLVTIPSLKHPRTSKLESLYEILSKAVGVRLRWVTK